MEAHRRQHNTEKIEKLQNGQNSSIIPAMLILMAFWCSHVCLVYIYFYVRRIRHFLIEMFKLTKAEIFINAYHFSFSVSSMVQTLSTLVANLLIGSKTLTYLVKSGFKVLRQMFFLNLFRPQKLGFLSCLICTNIWKAWVPNSLAENAETIKVALCTWS